MANPSKVILAIGIAVAASPLHGASFSEANKAFESGEFSDAVTAYESVIESGNAAPDVLFNLGNARYRLDERGKAALAWRRALALEPTHTESRQNLGFLKRKTGLLEFERKYPSIEGKFSENTLVTALTVFAWSLLLSLAVLFFLRPKATATALLVMAAVIGLAGAGLSGFALAAHWSNAPNPSLAVVTSESARAFTEPARSADDVISLPPGSEVRVVSSRGSWTYVDIPGDLRGWVESSNIERVLGQEPVGDA